MLTYLWSQPKLPQFVVQVVIVLLVLGHTNIMDLKALGFSSLFSRVFKTPKELIHKFVALTLTIAGSCYSFFANHQAGLVRQRKRGVRLQSSHH